VEESIEEITELKRELEALAAQQEDELEAIDLKWAEIVARVDTKKVSPMKKNITTSVLGVVWQPHWLVDLGGRVRLVAAG